MPSPGRPVQDGARAPRSRDRPAPGPRRPLPGPASPRAPVELVRHMEARQEREATGERPGLVPHGLDPRVGSGPAPGCPRASPPRGRTAAAPGSRRRPGPRSSAPPRAPSEPSILARSFRMLSTCPSTWRRSSRSRRCSPSSRPMTPSRTRSPSASAVSSATRASSPRRSAPRVLQAEGLLDQLDRPLDVLLEEGEPRPGVVARASCLAHAPSLRAARPPRLGPDSPGAARPPRRAR